MFGSQQSHNKPELYWTGRRTGCLQRLRFVGHRAALLVVLRLGSKLTGVSAGVLVLVLVLGHGRTGADNAHGVAASVLGQGRNGAGTLRGVSATGEIGSHEIGFVAIDGPLDPMNVLHINQPDVLSG